MSKQLTKSQKAMLRDRRSRFLKNPTKEFKMHGLEDDPYAPQRWFMEVRKMFPTETLEVSYVKNPLMDTVVYRIEVT